MSSQPDGNLKNLNVGGKHLPKHIIEEILLWLPAKSVARFRCVSKTWLSIATDHSFLRTLSHRASKSLIIQSPLTPWGSKRSIPAIFKAAESFSSGCDPIIRSKLTFPNEFYFHYIDLLNSCDGLILFCLSFSSHHIVNPLTSQCISLPELQFDKGCPSKSFGFYFHRWTNEYRLLSVVKIPMRFPYMSEVLSLGANSWRRLDVSPPVKKVCNYHAPVCVNDFLHWISYKTFKIHDSPVILVFDIKAELFSVMQPPPYPEDWKVILHKGKQLVDFSIVEVESKLGFYATGRDVKCMDDLIIDIWLLDDYKTKRWTKFYSVCFKEGCYFLDQVCFVNPEIFLGPVKDWHTSALYLKDGELLLLFDSVRNSFFIHCNMKSGEYCIHEIIKVDMSSSNLTFIYKESLISCDSFGDENAAKLSE